MTPARRRLPDLDRAYFGQRNPGGDIQRLVEVLRLDHDKAEQLLLGLRERAIGDQPFALPVARFWTFSPTAAPVR